MNVLVVVLVVVVSVVYGVYVDTNSSTCICTTVPCPVVGTNHLTLAGGGSMTYTYVSHNGKAVVSSATGSISKADLDKG